VVLTLLKADINKPIATTNLLWSSLRVVLPSPRTKLNPRPNAPSTGDSSASRKKTPIDLQADSGKSTLRPLRTLLSVLLIAIPVTLILTLVGLSQGNARGIRQAQSRRGRRHSDTAAKHFAAQLQCRLMPENLGEVGQQQPHVTLAVGTAIAVVSGITSVSGVDLGRILQNEWRFRFIEGARSKGRTIF